MIPGVDVSRYQSENFPHTGKKFVYIKATEGTSILNPHQVGQNATARKAGMVTGFYHFLRDGRFQQQAEFFVEKCLSVPGDPLIVDWEDKSVSCAEKDDFLRRVKKLRPTHKVLLYCNRDFWLNRDTTSFCADGLVIADYSAPAGKPRIQHPFIIHQYSETGGIDSDVANFSTQDAFRKWCNALV